jgi:hypothetical protein
MSHTLINLSFILPSLFSAPAPEKIEPPKGLPPQLQMIMSLDRDKGIITVATAVQIQKHGEKTVIEAVPIGNRVEQVAKKIPITWRETVTVATPYRLSDENISATDVFGRKLTKDEVWKLLVPGNIVAVSRDRDGLDKAYRAALTRDVVILIIASPELDR